MSKTRYVDACEPINLPVHGAAADVEQGVFLRKGGTPASHNGMLIAGTGSSALTNIIGRLQAKLDYSEEGETLINGTDFVLKPVLLAHPFRIHRVEYDLASLIDCTEAVSTTTITVTSLEDNIDAAFLYVVSGTGAGQTNYLTASASGSATLKAAFGTDLDTSSKFIKILPRFHELIGFNSTGDKLSSQAAAGAVTGFVIDTWMERGSKLEQMSPVAHAALTNLDDIYNLKFYADIALIDSIPYSIS